MSAMQIASILLYIVCNMERLVTNQSKFSYILYIYILYMLS